MKEDIFLKALMKQNSGTTGTQTKFVQDNQSFSTYGVLRGLHAQSGKHAQVNWYVC